MSKPSTTELDEIQDRKIPAPIQLEYIAQNIVFQIGDALYEALPKDVAHDHFVDARQATNDEAIDFAKRLIEAFIAEKVREARYDELNNVYVIYENEPIVWTDASGFPLRQSERLTALTPNTPKGE